MIPILGETVWSIIHGPAATGHLVEVSHFLKRPIDVWAEDRLLLFGQCHNRQKPRLHIKYKSLTNKCPSCKSSSKAVGHFTLLQGHEPRNPDARSHPENCGFDVISDQTGYPATALRQVAVQRMLAKLYESRLRGRDHHFQCPHCSVSGGQDWKIMADVISFAGISKEVYNTHAHVHFRRHSHENFLRMRDKCLCPRKYLPGNIVDYRTVICIQAYVKVHHLDENQIETVFEDERHFNICLWNVMREKGDEVFMCVCAKNFVSCQNNNMRSHASGQKSLIKDVPKSWNAGLGYKYTQPNNFKSFVIKSVKCVFACARGDEITASIRGARSNELYLVTMYPLDWRPAENRKKLWPVDATQKRGGGSAGKRPSTSGYRQATTRRQGYC